MMKRIVTVLFAAVCLLFLAAGCEKHDDALRVEMRVDGELYTCPAYSYEYIVSGRVNLHITLLQVYFLDETLLL